MKKIISIMVIACMLSAGFVIGGNNKKTITIEEIFQQPILVNMGRYAEIRMNGTNSFMLQPGKPLLPVKTIEMDFPLGTKIKDVKISISSVNNEKLDRKIEPVLTSSSISCAIDTKLYNSSSPYPEKWMTYSIGGGIKNGKHVTFLIIKINPVKYIPAKNLIKYIQKCKVDIDVDYKESREIDEKYDLLILSPSEFASSLQPLVDYKNGENMSTIMVTLDEIPVRGMDKQEDIKYYIKDAIEKWGVRYVLLVGSSSKFPVRYTHVCYANGNDIVDDEVFISDLYYADIYDSNGNFSSWDSNGNGIYGEYNWENTGSTDKVDLFPDVYLGRLACRDENEVETVVNKIINYEKMKPYGEEWFSNIVVVGGDTFPGDSDEIDEGEYEGQKILELMNNFDGIKIWASNGEVKYASNINNAIEDGAGFVSFSGHGSPTSWATHPHDKPNTWLPLAGYKVSDVDALSNGGKLPVVILDACSNSKFDEEPNCLGWKFVSQYGGGAIASCGNTALGWTYGGKATIAGLSGLNEYGSFRAYKEGAKTFGEMWANTLSMYLNQVGKSYALDYKTLEEWEPFGDPSIGIAPPSIPPYKPEKPQGPDSGKRGVTYEYTSSATDPDGDDVYYMFDWGDGTNTTWLGPYKSGEKVTASHSWEKRGTYEVRVKAKDFRGGQSGWSDPLEVKIKFSFNIQQYIEQSIVGMIIRLIRSFITGW